MNIKELKIKWLWKRIQENPSLWYQCVAWAKKAMLDLYWYKSWTFNNSAVNWWYSWSPFDSNWKRSNYARWLIPKEWDIIFFDSTLDNIYWHVAVVSNWINTIYSVTILEQNWWNGFGNWLWDNAITESVKSYSKCLGWFTYINNNNNMKTDYKKIMDTLIKETWISPIFNSHEWEDQMTEKDIRCLIEIASINIQKRQNDLISSIIDSISLLIWKKK